MFGSRALQPKNAVSLSLTQTFEAKRREVETDEATGSADLGGLPVDSVADGARAAADPLRIAAGEPQDPNAGPRQVQQTPSVTLLAWRTSVIQYDFVEADSVGLFLSGFETTRLSNQFSSDYLRGLSISMDHELFRDEIEADGRLLSRSLDPHLSQVNLGFSLGSSSSIFRWLGLVGGNEETQPEEPEELDPAEFQGTTDGSSVVPGRGPSDVATPRASRGGTSGGWTANLSYSLQRPRDPTRLASQMLSGTLRLQPTQNWSVSWRTAYDLELSSFNDHSIRLTRDLHRWQANFDFLQTATGNWTFRFEVSLLDNRDLKFDYNQRNLDLGLPSSQR